MAELEIRFDNFSLEENGIEDIYTIGLDGATGSGVIEEIAAAFEYELDATPSVDNLGGLIGEVGPAKELQENIGRVQEALGTDEDAVTIARGWVERSGLLAPVQRSYATAEAWDETPDVDLAAITGGVRNWIHRRADRLIDLQYDDGAGFGEALLVAGNRVMKTAEGPDVEEGMTEADYMGKVILPYLADASIPATLVRAETDDGDEVMEAGAEAVAAHLRAYGSLDEDGTGRLAIVSNAGAWVQNAGQFRRAMQRVISPDFDKDGSQIFAVSDSFPLGTGAEPTSTHQNPFSATGQIVRNAQELARHFE